MCVTHHGIQKQSTTRPSTIIHYHHPSAVWISQSIGSLCAFLLIQSNVEGERESISDRRRAGKGSQCVAVSLGPVNFAHHHPRLPHLAYFSFPRPQNHTVSCAKCLCPIVHILYKPSDHQVSLRFCRLTSSLFRSTSFSQSLHVVRERAMLPVLGRNHISATLTGCVCPTKER